MQNICLICSVYRKQSTIFVSLYIAAYEMKWDYYLKIQKCIASNLSYEYMPLYTTILVIQQEPSLNNHLILVYSLTVLS